MLKPNACLLKNKTVSVVLVWTRLSPRGYFVQDCPRGWFRQGCPNGIGLVKALPVGLVCTRQSDGDVLDKAVLLGWFRTFYNQQLYNNISNILLICIYMSLHHSDVCSITDFFCITPITLLELCNINLNLVSF